MRLLTVPEVAEMLRISEGTARDWVWKKRIPVVRISTRYIRVREEDVLDLIERNLVPAKE
jgi:excisionase family DNA binding protein